MFESRGKLKELFRNPSGWMKVVDILFGVLALFSALGLMALLMFMEG